MYAIQIVLFFKNKLLSKRKNNIMEFPKKFTPQFGINYSAKLKPGRNPVWFTSMEKKLAGNLYTPENFNEKEKYPTIVTINPAGATKEQSCGFYANKLREYGFIVLSFDNRTWGESEGWPRYVEDPFMKVEDTKNATTFLSCLDCVDEKKMAILGICSGAGYAAYTACFDIRLKSVATVSGIFDFPGWITQASVIPFDEMLQASANARKQTYLTGKSEYVQGWWGETVEDHKKRDQLWDQLTQYYCEGGNRGWYHVTNGDYRAVECVDNRYMMNVNPLLKYLGKRKLLAIRGEVSETGDLSNDAMEFMNKGCGEVFNVPKATHTDMYHVEEKVNVAIKKLVSFYKDTLKS